MKRLIRKAATRNEIINFNRALTDEYKKKVEKLYDSDETAKNAFEIIVDSGTELTPEIIDKIENDQYYISNGTLADVSKEFINAYINNKLERSEDIDNLLAATLKNCEVNEDTYNYMYDNYMDGNIDTDYKIEDDERVINTLKSNISKFDSDQMLKLLGEISDETLTELFNQDVIDQVGKGIFEAASDSPEQVLNIIKNLNLIDNIAKNNKSFQDSIVKYFGGNEYQSPDGIVLI